MQAGKLQINEILRVNLAGEYGALNIYHGQKAVFKNLPQKEHIYKIIADMYEGEIPHYEYFKQEICQRAMRPSALAPLWRIGALGLGSVSALMGEKYAMLATVAVEEVIADHYQKQINYLQEYADETDLCDHIAKFRDDELDHYQAADDYMSDCATSVNTEESGDNIKCRDTKHQDTKCRDQELLVPEKIFKKFVQGLCKVSIAVAKKI